MKEALQVEFREILYNLLTYKKEFLTLLSCYIQFILYFCSHY